MRTKSNKELWWIVRILSGLLIAFSLFMFIGESLDSQRSEPIEVSSIIGLSLAGLGLIGLGLAWKWELIGGIIALVAFIVIGAMEPTLFITPLVYIPCYCYFIYYALGKKQKFKFKDYGRKQRMNKTSL